MSTTAKIIYALLAIFAIGIGIEGYLYYQSFQKPKQPFTQTQQNGQASPELIEITGKVALVGSLNIFDITKDQVAEWAKTSGTVEIPAYSGPMPTLSGQSQVNDFSRPVSVKILAGYFRTIQGGSMIISQGGKDLTITFNRGARLWIKDKDKLQIVSVQLDKLLYFNKLSELIKANDLILAPGVVQQTETLQVQNLVVFR